ncbi:hypothetical protein YTPLAS18_31810 [Nitrospira sp.]|nr:hypothetical protein YTPLAS18_31810 [Nitrospira sp.]
MAVGGIPGRLDAALHHRATALKIRQIEPRARAAIGNLNLIARLPDGTGFEFQRKTMIRWRGLSHNRFAREACKGERNRELGQHIGSGANTRLVCGRNGLFHMELYTESS